MKLAVKERPILALLLVLVGVVVALGRSPLPDVAWPLYLAREILGGARLTVDFQEVNPPLFVWMSLPAALLGRLTGASPWKVNAILLGMTMGLSVLLSDRFLRLGSHAKIRFWLVLLIGFVLAIFPLSEFGEREHIALVLTVPYVLLAAARGESASSGKGTLFLAGVLAGVGIALKPYFLPAWFLVEMCLVGRRGWRVLGRTEAIAVVVVGTSYLASVVVLEPGYFRLAVTWADLYGRYLRQYFVYFAMFPNVWGVLPVFAALVLLAASLQGKRLPLHEVLLAASLGFWCAAVLQGKGLSYHHLPGAGYAVLLVGAVAMQPGRSGFSRPSDLILVLARAVSLAVPLIAGLALGLDLAVRRVPGDRDRDASRLLEIVRREAAGRRILVLSTNPASGWPLTLEAGARWGSRFMSQWQLAALYHDELWTVGGVVRPRPYSERRGVERIFHDAMIADLQRYKPQLILVLQVDSTVGGFGGATRIDYLSYFGSDLRFRAIIAGYDSMATVGRYRVLRRREDLTYSEVQGSGLPSARRLLPRVSGTSSP